MKIQRVTMTPEAASALLTHNVKNRPVAQVNLKKLKAELTAGNWRFNGDAIRRDKQGNLIDGQHRLMACVETGISFETLLIEGLDSETFDTIDQGKLRGGSDILAIAGYDRVALRSATLKVLHAYYTGRGSSCQSVVVSNHEIQELAAKYDVNDSLKWGTQPDKILLPSIAVAVHYITTKIDPVDSYVFMESVTHGTDLKAHDPVYQLRRRMIGNATSKGKISQGYALGITLKAWNQYRKKVKVTQPTSLRTEGDAPEAFPTAI